MEQPVSQIELAVQDMDRAAEFYQALGWLRADGPEGMVTFDLAGKTLGLYCKTVSGQNAGSDMRRGRYSGTIVAHNLANKSDVAPLLERARSAGATVLKEAQDLFWGGHHGYFADLDGHVWEIAHNPYSVPGPKAECHWNGHTGATVHAGPGSMWRLA